MGEIPLGIAHFDRHRKLKAALLALGERA